MATTCTATVPDQHHHRCSLGGEIDVPTLAGKAVPSTSPKARQTGKQFRLRGKGVKGVRASYPGDLYCHIAWSRHPVKLNEHAAQAAARARRVVPEKCGQTLAQHRQLDRSAEKLLHLTDIKPVAGI
jgi:DnaJ-class molecular chaperone